MLRRIAGWFRTPTTPTPRRTLRPRLEALEARDCPALTLTYNISYGAQHALTITGHVGGMNSSTGGVTFSGVVAGNAVINANGDFTYQGQATALGAVHAIARDTTGDQSPIVDANVTSAAPSVSNFAAQQGAGNCWTFTGRVTDESAAGLTVRFSGLPSLQGRMAQVQADGTFSITVQLAPGETGTATAQTTDWWGLTSNVAEYTL